MEEESTKINYIIYVLVIYSWIVYIYGILSYFNLKSTCSSLRNTGVPGQKCVSPFELTTRCWKEGSELSCSHCIFGYKSDQFGGHVCKSSTDVSNSAFTCRYNDTTTKQFPPIEQSGETGVTIKYALSGGQYAPYTERTLDDDKHNKMLNMLIQNCYYELEVESEEAVKTECKNISENGDGICRKDYDTFVKRQKIRYRPDTANNPLLRFTKNVT